MFEDFTGKNMRWLAHPSTVSISGIGSIESPWCSGLWREQGLDKLVCGSYLLEAWGAPSFRSGPIVGWVVMSSEIWLRAI